MTGGSGALYADAVAAARVPPVPPIGATAAAIVDGDTGDLLWGKDPHLALHPASMTKMMTALVALQQGHPDQIVVSNVDASTMVGDSVMGLHPGERLSLRDLLFGLLVPSGDDAALAIARGISGDDATFVTLMNAEGLRLGLTDTHFANPHGLDAPGHLSSPYDMIAIARTAMRDPLFRQIVATKQITIQGRWIYNLSNTNLLLGQRPGVVGVKTGTTDLALHAITVADNRTGHMVYVTVMHTTNYVPDVTALLDYVESNDVWVPLTPPETPLAQVTTSGGDRVLATAWDESAVQSRWQANTLRTDLTLTADSPLRETDDPDLPPADDGVATFLSGGEPVAQLPLHLK